MENINKTFVQFLVVLTNAEDNCIAFKPAWNVPVKSFTPGTYVFLRETYIVQS